VFNDNRKLANNQEKMLSKLDTMQGDFKLMTADVAGIKKSLEDHKRDTNYNLEQQDAKIDKASMRIDALQSEQTAAKASIATIKFLGGGALTFLILIGGWYLNNINSSVKTANDTASINAQKIEQIQRIQDERKDRIASIEDRVSKLREDVIALRRGNTQ
jgi:DNA repair exonuclease SbcCD ATPase subunit